MPPLALAGYLHVMVSEERPVLDVNVVKLALSYSGHTQVIVTGA